MKRPLVLLLFLCTGACQERRKPLKLAGDAGPAVVVVDPVKRTAPPLPLVDEQEPDDDLKHAQPIEAGKGIRGTIGSPKTVKGRPAGDEDVYTWVESGSAPDGGFLAARVELSGVPGLDLSLEILDGDGKRLWLASDAPVGEGEVIPNLAVEPGHTYYARVRSLTPQAGERPYELVVRAAPPPPGDEREPNDDAARATVLPALSDASGFYGRKRDEDLFQLPAQSEPGTLRLEVGPVEGVVPQVRVLDGQTVVAEAKAGRGDELRLRNVGLPDRSRPHYVALRALDGRNPDVRWTLRLGWEPPLDGAEREPNDTPARATPLSLEGGAAQVAGFLWPGDADLFRVTGAAGGLVTVELEAPERVDVRLERLDGGGKPLVRADEGGPGKPERLPPWPGGDFLLRVSARPRDSAFDAPYRLTVTPQPADPELEREPNNTPQEATPLGQGQAAVRGFIAPRGDEDVYRFVAPAGSARVTAEAAGLTVRLTDEAKAPLGPAQGLGRASGPVVAGKTYYVSVKGAGDKSASAAAPYTLSLRFE